MSTYQVSYVTMLLEFHTGELSHVCLGGGIRYVVGAANNVSPQRDHLLSFYKLYTIVRVVKMPMTACSLRGPDPKGFFLVLVAGKAASWLSLHTCATFPRQRLYTTGPSKTGH